MDREYLFSITPGGDETLQNIRKEAQADLIPIIRDEVRGLLEWLMAVHRPLRVLEVGAAYGYSSLCMAQHLPPGAVLTTLERNPANAARARENFGRMAFPGVEIRLLEGEAEGLLSQVLEEEGPGSYDFIFLDAAKGQYQTFLPACLALLKGRGILVSDNVLQEGFVAKSRYAVHRRNRTIHKRMREYLWNLQHHPQLVTSILSCGDGVTLSMKKEG